MSRFKSVPLIAALLAACLQSGVGFALGERWTEQQANAWYLQQPWLVGSNYVPKSAINQLEMWQEETFDPAGIDTELTWAEAIGMNTMRVFLHDLLWQQDAPGFRIRMDRFLRIAARHHIRPMFVLFDSVWDPSSRPGPQHPPIPGIHNSGWVQSPGAAGLTDPKQYARLREYVKGVVGAFSKDERILAWDIWNEPGGDNTANYPQEPRNKVALVTALLPRAFEWAREADPRQPLTSGLWRTDYASPDPANLWALQQIQLSESDVISFHNYAWPEDFAREVSWLKKYNRPMICTEYMARSVGSTFDTILPIAKREHVGAINWGFVAGKTQTYFPWDSWSRGPYIHDQPIWHHDLLRSDGTPYRQAEVDLIRQLTGKQ